MVRPRLLDPTPATAVAVQSRTRLWRALSRPGRRLLHHRERYVPLSVGGMQNALVPALLVLLVLLSPEELASAPPSCCSRDGLLVLPEFRRRARVVSPAARLLGQRGHKLVVNADVFIFFAAWACANSSSCLASAARCTLLCFAVSFLARLATAHATRANIVGPPSVY